MNFNDITFIIFIYDFLPLCTILENYAFHKDQQIQQQLLETTEDMEKAAAGFPGNIYEVHEALAPLGGSGQAQSSPRGDGQTTMDLFGQIATDQFIKDRAKEYVRVQQDPKTTAGELNDALLANCLETE